MNFTHKHTGRFALFSWKLQREHETKQAKKASVHNVKYLGKITILMQTEEQFDYVL